MEKLILWFLQKSVKACLKYELAIWKKHCPRTRTMAANFGNKVDMVAFVRTKAYPPAEWRKTPGKRSQLTSGVNMRQISPIETVIVIRLLLRKRPFLSTIRPNTSVITFIENPPMVPAVLKITSRWLQLAISLTITV